MATRFHPTLHFGILVINGRDRLHQLYASETGEIEWRMLPMIELGPLKTRPAAIAGFIPEDEETLD